MLPKVLNSDINGFIKKRFTTFYESMFHIWCLWLFSGCYKFHSKFGNPMKPDAYGLPLFVKHCSVVDKNHYFKGNILSQTFGNAFLSRFLFCLYIYLHRMRHQLSELRISSAHIIMQIALLRYKPNVQIDVPITRSLSWLLRFTLLEGRIWRSELLNGIIYILSAKLF